MKFSWIVIFIFCYASVFSQTPENLSSITALKKLSFEELLNIEVTSVSKKPERLGEVASAIQVITHEDIRRSGATSLPEALRLSPNLQVAQLHAYAWIISARGFNGVFSNKLLVMIDGRTVYSPLFAGVYWDAQSVLLEDVERIEVISGPGGTMWGANAVNGVINIITKRATETQGLYASLASGSLLKRHGTLRYGGKIGSNFSYRVFAQHNARGNTFLNDSTDYPDEWYFSQTGFQADWDISEHNQLSIQSNFYAGKEKTLPTSSTLDGQNALVRFSHTFSEQSEFILQAYYDRTWRRDIPSTFSDELDTYDLDLQQRFQVWKWFEILCGGGYRFMKDKSQHSTTFVGLIPEHKNMPLYTTFVQAESTLIEDVLKVTLGAKLQHNVYSGGEIQPRGSIAYNFAKNQTLWGSVSRAVRAPSRIDVDYQLPTYEVPSGVPNVDGGPNFTSEKVVTYELGYRVQPRSSMSFSLATFYSDYKDLYTVEALPPPDNLTYQIQNGAKGYSYGLEFSGTYQIVDWFKLRGGYTYFYKELEPKAGHAVDRVQLENLGHDAQDRFLFQSIVNLPAGFQFDIVARYVSRLPDFTSDYFNFDARLAWVYGNWELSIVGQNLWEERHREYVTTQIPRSVYGKITCRLFKDSSN